MMSVPVMLAMLAGCNGGGSGQASDGAYREVSAPVELVAKSRPPIPDVPVPIGFDLDENRSRNFAAAGLRTVDHLYKGNADKFAVARFYKRQMPISRWVLVTDRFAQGDIILDFEKETEHCSIMIDEGDMWNSVFLKVQVWTSGRIPESPETKSKPGGGR
jgi:hypothetical protein